MRGLVAWSLALVCLPATGCKDDAFFCADDSQCMEDGLPGICQANDLCSFPSADCPSGHAYGQHAGTLAGRCVEDMDGATSSATDTTTATTAATSVADTSSTDPVATTLADDTTTGIPPGDSSTAGPSTNDTGPAGLPNGSGCSENADCASQACYASVLSGSVCGECLTDADCAYGCNPPSLVDPRGQPSECSDGSLGNACETEEACASEAHICALFADVPGFITISSCSECATDAACVGASVCDMFFDPVAFRGGYECVAQGSDAIGEFCSSDLACAQQCAIGSINGFFEFGVCSECADDTDCAGRQSCTTPELDLLTGVATPAMCG